MISATSIHKNESNSETDENAGLSGSINKQEMNVDENQSFKSPDEKVLGFIKWYVNHKNDEKQEIVRKHNELAVQFEKERTNHQSLKDMMAQNEQKIAKLTCKNNQFRLKVKEATDREEEMQKQLMGGKQISPNQMCVRCASKSKCQFHSLSFCSNRCYREMAALFQK